MLFFVVEPDSFFEAESGARRQKIEAAQAVGVVGARHRAQFFVGWGRRDLVAEPAAQTTVAEFAIEVQDNELGAAGSGRVLGFQGMKRQVLVARVSVQQAEAIVVLVSELADLVVDADLWQCRNGRFAKVREDLGGVVEGAANEAVELAELGHSGTLLKENVRVQLNVNWRV